MLVDEFNCRFKLTQYEYKKKLHHHVENGLGSKLGSKLERELNVENIRQKMTGNK